jgi:hypothetical protein
MLVTEPAKLKRPTKKSKFDYNVLSGVIVECDDCHKKWNIAFVYRQLALEKYGKDLCRSCRLKLQYANGRESAFKKLNKEWAVPWELRFGKERSEQLKQSVSKRVSGTGNPNYGGKHCHGFGDSRVQHLAKGSTYVEVYGEDKAADIKRRISLKTSGSNNPMYGKQTPQGSGNGWSGWFHKYFFRSLKELSFLVNVLEKNHLKWKSAENIKIPYVSYDGTHRTYRPDFIVGNKLIEIKPSRLKCTPLNAIKAKTAKVWAEEHNMTYEVVTENDFEMLSFEKIRSLKESGDIRFIERYEKKFAELESKESNSN